MTLKTTPATLDALREKATAAILGQYRLGDTVGPVVDGNWKCSPDVILALVDDVTTLRAENERLMALAGPMVAAGGDLIRERDTLRAAVTRLREVLAEHDTFFKIGFVVTGLSDRREAALADTAGLVEP